MEKLSKKAVLAILWTITGIIYSPIFLLAWVIRIIARLLLAISYFGLLNFKMAKDVFKSLFIWYDTKI